MRKKQIRGFSVGLLLSISLFAWPMFAQESATAEYLSELAQDRMLFVNQGWGRLGINTAVVPMDGRDPSKLKIGSVDFEKGLGHHAPGEIVVDLEGRYASFEAQVGVQFQNGGNGSVVFQVYVDDALKFDSGVMKEQDPAKPVNVPIAGAQELRLVAKDAGDGISCDCADWAEARLIPDPNAPAAPSVTLVNIAPFGMVTTWDPDRSEGTKAKRVEEFPVEDLFPGTEVLPGPDGTYSVPVAASGKACIGLEWAERRFVRRLTVDFADPAQMPSIEGALVEYWSGESPWQGEWKPVSKPIEATETGWTVRVDYRTAPGGATGAEKIRWIIPAANPIAVKSLAAFTGSPLRSVELSFELENPIAGAEGTISAYNGSLVDSATQGDVLSVKWDLGAAARHTIHYCAPKPWKTDRTVLRFQLPNTALGVAVDDILNNKCVYVPHAGLFVTTGPTLAEHLAAISSEKTVLERVHEMPDQTFAAALKKVHNPVQNNGPMMLSLACDNRKYVTHQDGSVTFEIYETPDQEVGWPDKYSSRLAPQFGSGQPNLISRHLEGDWLPAPVTVVNDSGLEYTQRTYVAPVDETPIANTSDWLYERAVCVAEYSIANPQTTEIEGRLALVFSSKEEPACLPIDLGFSVTLGDRVLALVDTLGAISLTPSAEPGAITLTGKIAAGATVGCRVYIPAWKLDAADYSVLRGDWFPGFQAYWQKVLEPAAAIETPDTLLNNVIRASQVHCYLAARNEARGERVSAYIASDRYGPLESESHAVIRGMDLTGNQEFARRSLDFFIHRYSPDGFLTTGYTLMGTGWHLWTLADYFQRSGNTEWLQKHADEVARVCKWIVAQCEKTKKLDAHGEKIPEYGLVPPGVAADWNRYAYRFAAEAHYLAGLRDAARALDAIGHPEAEGFLENADAFKESLLRAYRLTQGQSPVLQLQNKSWVPAYPGMLYCYGRIEDIIPGEDGNRSWAYDVELGAHHLAALGVMEPNSPEVNWMMNHMEGFWFLHSGMGDYPEEKNKADFFNLGGFSKVQPYYTRNAEIYAMRDDPKAFIRSYFNTIPSLLSLENLSFWEHFHNTGAWNKTHETGYFLAQTRLMMAIERDKDLWLAPFVPTQWLEDGGKVSVRNVPTVFGNVSYTIASSLASSFIEASIEPPARVAPAAIVMRLRVPEAKPIQSVTLNGQPHAEFDAVQGTIRLPAPQGPIALRIQY